MSDGLHGPPGEHPAHPAVPAPSPDDRRGPDGGGPATHPAPASRTDLDGVRPVAHQAGRLLQVDGLRPVSPRLVPARYVAGIVGYVLGVLLVAAAVVGAVLTSWWWLGLLGLLPLVLVLQGLLLTPRRVRALGYLDGPEELTVASGLMFRSVTTVPYGRVQSVKIDEGPVDRRYGLAKLTFSTAADGSGVTLPGLPREEAERLRALLSERGLATMAAL